MKNKKAVIVAAVLAVLLTVVGVVLWYIYIQKPRNEAVNNYETTVAQIETKNKELALE